MEEQTAPVKKSRSVLGRIVRVLFWICLLPVVLLLALLTLLFVYEDEVKSAIVSEMNKHLKAEVKIDPKNIDLTIIKTFPDCSIEFKDLLMLEALKVKQRDTLLFAGRLNLHFNIEDLWNKKYEINKIRVQDALVKLRVLKDGRTNYIFWESKEDGTKQTGDSLSFNLKLISIENCRLTYKNKKTLFKTALAVKSLRFTGQFKEKNFEMSSDGKLLIEELVHGKISYLNDKQLDFKIGLQVEDDSYTLKEAHINLNKLGFELRGKFSYADSLGKMELHYNAPDLDISSLLSLLPDNYRNKISDYRSSGNFYAGGTIRYLGKEQYSVVSDFGIRQGMIEYKPNSAIATQVNLDGYLNYSEKGSVLSLKNIHLNLNNDEIRGNCLINNFQDPYLQLNAKAAVKLENLVAFWPIDTLTQVKGALQLETEIEGALSLLKEQTFSEKVKFNAEATVNNLEAQFKHDEKVYAVEHCILSAKDRHAEVRDLKLKRGSSDVTLNGRIPGLFNYIVDRKAPLVITGSLHSEKIVLEDFLSNSKSSSQANNDPLIPANVNFKLEAVIAKFSFGKFEAEAIKGELEIKNQKAMVSEMKLKTMQGEAEIDAFADNSGKDLDVAIKSSLKNINITGLFEQMNNFGQSTLTGNNLKGLATAEIEFSGSWDNKLVSDLKSINAKCDLLIEKGELNDFKPLQSLSKFVDIEELKRIKFSSLHSKVEIKNSKISIPSTQIKNSALDLEVWGTHSFNNDIDYHIQLLVSQYLAKKHKDKDSEFGVIEDDSEERMRAFIAMKGTLDDPQIKYLDAEGMKKQIKKNVEKEGKNMKRVLQEEWNLFKKDTSLKKPKKEEPRFELEQPKKEQPKKTLEPKRKEDEEDF